MEDEASTHNISSADTISVSSSMAAMDPTPSVHPEVSVVYRCLYVSTVPRTCFYFIYSLVIVNICDFKTVPGTGSCLYFIYSLVIVNIAYF
jgi:hypothetical protein